MTIYGILESGEKCFKGHIQTWSVAQVSRSLDGRKLPPENFLVKTCFLILWEIVSRSPFIVPYLDHAPFARRNGRQINGIKVTQSLSFSYLTIPSTS